MRERAMSAQERLRYSRAGLSQSRSFDRSRAPRPFPAPSGGVAAMARARASRRSGVWLISFTDLVCLMLAFFVLKFSMTEPDRQRLRDMAGALTGRVSPVNVIPYAASSPESPIPLGYLTAVLNNQFAGLQGFSRIVAEYQGDRVVIRLPGDQIFTPGCSDLSVQGDRILFVLGGVLGRINNRIEVIGHAEVFPGNDPWAADRWALALGRAAATAGEMRENGYRRTLAVRAIAATAAPSSAMLGRSSASSSRSPPKGGGVSGALNVPSPIDAVPGGTRLSQGVIEQRHIDIVVREQEGE
ncbi:hypothetical protein CCP2SC5_230025 [Azospirillaceae bacterium]